MAGATTQYTVASPEQQKQTRERLEKRNELLKDLQGFYNMNREDVNEDVLKEWADTTRIQTPTGKANLMEALYRFSGLGREGLYKADERMNDRLLLERTGLLVGNQLGPRLLERRPTSYLVSPRYRKELTTWKPKFGVRQADVSEKAREAMFQREQDKIYSDLMEEETMAGQRGTVGPPGVSDERSYGSEYTHDDLVAGRFEEPVKLGRRFDERPGMGPERSGLKARRRAISDRYAENVNLGRDRFKGRLMGGMMGGMTGGMAPSVYQPITKERMPVTPGENIPFVSGSEGGSADLTSIRKRRLGLLGKLNPWQF